MKEKITVACGQILPEFGATNANLDKMIALVREHHPDLMVFPELATSGYEIRSRGEALSFGIEIPSSEPIARLQEAASATGSHIALGLPEASGEKVYNSAVLIEPTSKVSTYRKLHLFDREKSLFDPGDIPLHVVETEIGRLGMMICFDWIFPEVARTLGLLGAQIIIHPANLVLQYCQKAMYARSVENGVFSITCNRIGSETNTDRTLTFTGYSQILSNRGAVLAQGEANREEVISADIHPGDAENKLLTPHNHIFSDRRTEFYSYITQSKSESQ